MIEVLNVLAAALASYIFGSIYYMSLAERWMAASGVARDDSGKPVNASNPVPYIAAFLAAVVVAGMMRHVFALSGIDTWDKGLLSGLGIGAFLATPWLVTCYGFSDKKPSLMLIDGGYATVGCGLMGLVLTLF